MSDPSATTYGVTFTRPIVGPKVYLSRGASGHTETFRRNSADHELETYLGNINTRLAAEGFIRKMSLERKVETWDDVIEYLAEMTKLDIDHIPVHVAVAFWANVDQIRAAAKQAKLDAKAQGN